MAAFSVLGVFQFRRSFTKNASVKNEKQQRCYPPYKLYDATLAEASLLSFQRCISSSVAFGEKNPVQA